MANYLPKAKNQAYIFNNLPYTDKRPIKKDKLNN